MAQYKSPAAIAYMTNTPSAHPFLGQDEGRLLTWLADPEASLPSLPDAAALSRIIIAADRHGVMAMVGRKLAAAAIPSGGLTAVAAELLARHAHRHMLAVGQAMLLDYHGQRLARRFESEGVAAAIVKGPVFASRLYHDRCDRPFTDVDFLIAPETMARANEIIAGEGFTRPMKRWDNADRDQEYKWLLDGNSSVLVELHGNLVHYPRLRRRISFGYRECRLAFEAAGDGRIADLMVAIVHSACGHKFHRLNMLVDVLQAARRLAPGDEAALSQVADRLAARLEVAVTLGVVGELFADERLVGLAGAVSDHWAVRVGRGLIKAETVLSAQAVPGRASHLRRHLFRQFQQLGFARP
jgi:hypothetical protein